MIFQSYHLLKKVITIDMNGSGDLELKNSWVHTFTKMLEIVSQIRAKRSPH